MLTVDVSYLTIPGVVPNNVNASDTINQTDLTTVNILELIAITLSIVASVASIVTGMLLVRHNSTKLKEPPTDAVSE
jgi:hypothetical protein